MTEERRLRVLLVLHGAHRIPRGAEVAFENIAEQLACAGDDVTLVGGGPPRSAASYRYIQVQHRGRESFDRWRNPPPFRDSTVYEQAAFTAKMARFDVRSFDVTLTCSYPFVNWWLRLRAGRSHQPKHVFVTQNGDWPAQRHNAEFRYFDCDGLVCTNPEFYDRHQGTYRTTLIPNGVDSRFMPGVGERERLGLPAGPIVLMVSALIRTKRVLEGVQAVARMPGVHLVVAGDGPEREEVLAAAERLLPGRFTRLTVDPEDMPALYRSADVLLHLSDEEAFGNVYLEAACCDLPVVAINNRSVHWILGDGRWLMDRFDESEVVRLLSEALRTGRDQVTAARATRCREANSWERVGAAYRQFLRTVVGAPVHRPRRGA